MDLSSSISRIDAAVSITARSCPGKTFSPSFTYNLLIRPVILLTSVTGGFTVVISTWAGTTSGYLISHERRINRAKTEKIKVVPHRIILRGGFDITSLTGSEYIISGFLFFIYVDYFPSSSWFLTRLKYGPLFSIRVSCVPISTILPLSMTTILSAFLTVLSL